MCKLAGSGRVGFKWVLQACAALALALAASAASADDLKEAGQLLRAGQHQQALERINKVLAAKPRDAQARFLKGLILTEQGSTKEAVAIFQKLTEDYPDLPEPYNNLAVIYAAQGQYDKARTSLEQSIRTHPSYATAYENLGDVYAKLASQAYDKALHLDSSNSTAQNKLALVRELVGGAPRNGVPVAGGAPAKPVAVAAATPAPAPAESRPAAALAPKPEPKPAVAAKPAPAEAKPAVVAKAAEKPAPKAAANGADEILRTVGAWAEAWSQKNVEAYLGFYAKDFKTPNGESRGEWEKGRRVRVSAPKSISVEVDKPRVTFSGERHASVTFRQHYKSDTLNVNGGKTLELEKTGAGWRIQQERSAN